MLTNRCNLIQRKNKFLKLSVSTAYRYTFILAATFGRTYVFVFSGYKKIHTGKGWKNQSSSFI